MEKGSWECYRNIVDMKGCEKEGEDLLGIESGKGCQGLEGLRKVQRQQKE